MKICSIASGSSGNCIYVGTEQTHILIDAGISGKRTEQGLNSVGLTMRDIDAIFITHEHSDHIGGLGVLSRKCEIPVYGTRGTIDAILNTKSIGNVNKELFYAIHPEKPFELKDIVMKPMKVSHDAAEAVAYRIYHGNRKIGVITDLGTYDENTIEQLKDMDVLFAEANHDIRMLQVGPYPYYLKQRILGERGHLSNEVSGRMLSELLHDNLKAIILGHLSRENNMAELAYETVRLEIANGENEYHANDFPIYVAKRNEPMQAIAI